MEGQQHPNECLIHTRSSVHQERQPDEAREQSRGSSHLITRRGLFRRAAQVGIGATAASLLYAAETFSSPEKAEAAKDATIVWQCELYNNYMMHGTEAYSLENDVAEGWGNHFNWWFYTNQTDFYLLENPKTRFRSFNTHVRVFDHPEAGYTEWRMGKGILKNPGGDIDTGRDPSYFETIVQTQYKDYIRENGMTSLEDMSKGASIGMLEAFQEGNTPIFVNPDLLYMTMFAIMEKGAQVLDNLGNTIQGAQINAVTQKTQVQHMMDLYNASVTYCPANIDTSVSE